MFRQTNEMKVNPMKKAIVLILLAAIMLLPASALAKQGNTGKGHGKDKGNPIETLVPKDRGNTGKGQDKDTGGPTKTDNPGGSGNNAGGRNDNDNGIGFGKGLTQEQQEERL